jgi:alkylation response protein AidB-like acyl-CoA dehydrogenase
MQASFLSDQLLRRFEERAPIYDQENRFFTEDFDDLRKAGYLTLNVPKDLGGTGLLLPDLCREQRTLAYYAPATALAVNMHLYWVGVAAQLWYAGDRSLEWLLKGAIKGEVYAAGHAESGNDIPVLLATTRAERSANGYRFTGRKAFGSLSPVWTYLGIHGMDLSDPSAPKVVHGFMGRDSKGYRIEETWDALGMRATASQDTLLDGVEIPDAYIARIVPAGAAGLDQFVLSIFCWALLGFANIYYGIAQRMVDTVIENVKQRKSIALSRPLSYHAGIQHNIAQMVLGLESIGPYLDQVASDWAKGVDYGAGWVIKIFGAKYHAVETSWRIVDLALDTLGGFGIFKKAGLERLFRDARLGRIHPANAMLTHEIVAKITLGISLDETPRWG